MRPQATTYSCGKAGGITAAVIPPAQEEPSGARPEAAPATRKRIRHRPPRDIQAERTSMRPSSLRHPSSVEHSRQFRARRPARAEGLIKPIADSGDWPCGPANARRTSVRLAIDYETSVARVQAVIIEIASRRISPLRTSARPV